jgi:hypothetical protein
MCISIPQTEATASPPQAAFRVESWVDFSQCCLQRSGAQVLRRGFGLRISRAVCNHRGEPLESYADKHYRSKRKVGGFERRRSRNRGILRREWSVGIGWMTTVKRRRARLGQRDRRIEGLSAPRVRPDDFVMLPKRHKLLQHTTHFGCHGNRRQCLCRRLRRDQRACRRDRPVGLAAREAKRVATYGAFRQVGILNNDGVIVGRARPYLRQTAPSRFYAFSTLSGQASFRLSSRSGKPCEADLCHGDPVGCPLGAWTANLSLRPITINEAFKNPSLDHTEPSSNHP